MKKIILFFSISIYLFSCADNKDVHEGNFELKGKLTNSNGESIYLEQMSAEGLFTIDTAIIDATGEFAFNTDLNEKGFYRIKLSENNFATLILDSGERVVLNGNATDLGSTFQTEGSQDTKLLMEFTENSKTNYRIRDSLQKAYEVYINSMRSKMKTSSIDSMSAVVERPFDSLLNKYNLYVTGFIEQHLTSFASLAAVQELTPDDFFPYYEKLDEALLKKYPNSSYARLFHKNIDAIRGLPLGSVAPEITLNTPEGKSFSLSSLKGKIVLIDFWASWCGPCRAENPNVVKAYNKYKSKGFEVLGVSLDKENEKWIDAIKKDNLGWTHISDLGYWSSSVVGLYKFQSIPTSYLLDKEGKIIAKNLRGEALENKLEELFK